MFNYYDNRNIKRINEITGTNKENDEIITKILKSSAYMNHYFQWKDKQEEKKQKGIHTSSEYQFSGTENAARKVKKNSNLLEVDKPPLIMGAPEAANGKIAE